MDVTGLLATSRVMKMAYIGAMSRLMFFAVVLSLLSCGMNEPRQPPAGSILAPTSHVSHETTASVSQSSVPSTSATTTAAPQVGKPRQPIRSSPEAQSMFRAAWGEEVLPGATTKQRLTFVNDWTPRVESGPLTAHLTNCRVEHHRVDTTLGGEERSLLVLFASIDALDIPDACWAVQVGGHFNEVLGYLDPKTGALVMVWLVPEG